MVRELSKEQPVGYGRRKGAEIRPKTMTFSQAAGAAAAVSWGASPVAPHSRALCQGEYVVFAPEQVELRMQARAADVGWTLLVES